MNLITAKNWADYELLDSGGGDRLERFGKYILIRPDPQAVWQKSLPNTSWQKADAVFTEHWKKLKAMPDQWSISYEQLTINCKLSPFKHTGVFPEQSVHWEFINTVISNEVRNLQILRSTQNDNIQILNLFGYTGITSLIAAQSGAKVTHVDASYPTISWARENQKSSQLEDKPIRWILDDCIKFCQRELKRGVKYDGIIMDPPVYGHGPKGEKWDFNKSFPHLLELCTKLLSTKPLFLIVNAYAISASSLMLENVLTDFLGDYGGKIESGELVLKESSPSGRFLSTGIFAKWSK